MQTNTYTTQSLVVVFHLRLAGSQMSRIKTLQLLHYAAIHYTALHYAGLHYALPNYAALHCTALQCTALHCPALHYTALHCTALQCTVTHCTVLPWTTLHLPTTHYTALKCTTLYSMLGCTTQHNIQHLTRPKCKLFTESNCALYITVLNQTSKYTAFCTKPHCTPIQR